MLFPQFDGDNPKLCLSRAKSHFEMYFVHPAVWVRVATHHFTHAAARWLQSIEHRLHNVTWETFSAMVWSTTVSAVTNMNFFFAKCSIYACLPPFQTISTGLLASSNSWLPIHLILTLSPILLGSLMVYVMTFVVLFWLLVLRTSILRALWPCCRRRRVIKVGAGNSVHRKGPCSPRRRPSRGHFLFRPLLRVHFPIPRLPIVTKPGGPPLDDRFSTLRNYRRARGLCVRCGEKWAPGHKCPPVPQLHVLQEIWDVCQAEFEAPDSPESLFHLSSF